VPWRGVYASFDISLSHGYRRLIVGPTDTTLDIRSAEPGDVEALLRLYEELSGPLDEVVPEPLPDPRQVLEEISADPRRTLLVAVLDGAVVGTVDVLIAPNLTHYARPWVLVENVVVASSARRLGVGRALMERALDIARAAGCYKVNLISGEQRTGAHDFYRSLGFAAIGQGFKLYLDPPAKHSPGG
jgi:GNAT superfamily N-acetyltransferase